MKHFDVVVLGAGSAGELIANQLANSGRSVALVEKLRVGGECAYVSCVPSKSMLKSARVRDDLKKVVSSGAVSRELELDSNESGFLTAVRRRDVIAENRDDSGAAANAVSAGVILFRGEGRFLDSNTLQINDQELSWSDLVLSTGSHASVPTIEGIDEIEFWTSDMALSQTDLPKSVAIVGGGPVGCELAQIYSSFGAETNLLEFAAQLVEKEHPLISKRLAENLATSGVSIYLNTNVVRLEKLPEKQTRVHLEDGTAIDVERVILATGRKPTTSGFNLEVLELELEKNGAVTVDGHCRALGKSNIWAAGDVTGIAPYTHTANYQGQIIVDNITDLPRTASYDAIPRAIYTNPPVVSVGRLFDAGSETSLVQAQNEISHTARFLTDGGSDGLVILVADLNEGILVGASAIGPNADDWMSEVVLAIHAKVPISVLVELVHGFPTFGEVLAQPFRELAAKCNTSF
jgi:dihydrolipoamide dehydrogenase